jgi:hypothetical protein
MLRYIASELYAYEKAGDPRFKEELRMSQAVKDKIKRLYGDN